MNKEAENNEELDESLRVEIPWDQGNGIIHNEIWEQNLEI